MDYNKRTSSVSLLELANDLICVELLAFFISTAIHVIRWMCKESPMHWRIADQMEAASILTAVSGWGTGGSPFWI